MIEYCRPIMENCLISYIFVMGAILTILNKGYKAILREVIDLSELYYAT